MQELIPLVGSVLNILLALFVFSRGYRMTVIRVYSLLGLCIAIWNLGTYFLFVVKDDRQALFWARFLQFGVIFIPVLLFHLSLLVAQIPVGKYIPVLYALHCILALSNFSDFFIKDVVRVSYAYYSRAGLGFWFYSALFAQLHLSVFILLKKRRKLPPLHKKRLTGLIIAAGSFAVFGLNDIFPIFKIFKYSWANAVVDPFGGIGGPFFWVVVRENGFAHHIVCIPGC